MSTATLRDQSTLKGRTSKDEADIRAIVESVHQAHHNKDAAALVAPYAQDAVIFNLAPPLSHRGMDLQEKQAWLDTWEGPIDCESREIDITLSGDFAFCHGFYRLSGTRMRGPQPYFAKVMTMFVGMDSLLCKEFEAGLDNMKAVAERQSEVREPDGQVVSNLKRSVLCN